MKLHVTLLICLLASSYAMAIPQLKGQAELVADGELKAKVLANAVGVPAPTPKSQRYIRTRGSERTELKCYNSRVLWRLAAYAGEWKDKKGNVQRLFRVKSAAPEDRWSERQKIEDELAELEKNFTGSEEELNDWKTALASDGVGKFVELKGKRYYIEFEFAEKVKATDADKLLKAFEKSMNAIVSGGGNNSTMKWWEESNEQYRFLTDLDRAKGGKFIKDAMRQMEALRKSFEFYVPPKKKVGVCTVRVFKTLAGYREYRASTGEEDTTSCGLWDPNREELLIAAEDPKSAQNTMRHESFHQYLFYATGNGWHSTWFNEGHATFFENIEYNSGKNTIKVTDKGNRAMWVGKDPEKHAHAIESVIAMPRDQFYSGDLNLHYCTAWAICYFLEKGAYTSEEFAPYRKILPKYLELTSAGVNSAEATREAWSVVANRNVASDFLKFWKEKRKLSVNAR